MMYVKMAQWIMGKWPTSKHTNTIYKRIKLFAQFIPQQICKKWRVSKYFKVCASSGTGVFAFFAFIVLNLNVMVDVMFSAMIDIMINGTFSGISGRYANIIQPYY